jgi:hypothetical protein
MQPRVLLRLIAMPTLTGSMLAMTLLPVAAAEVSSPKISDVATCDIPKAAPHKPAASDSTTKENLDSSAVEIVVEYPALDFTAAESDAAVRLFGCDCPACLNMLQQLRSQPLLASSQGHCLTAMQQRVSPQDVQTILQTLDAETVN